MAVPEDPNLLIMGDSWRIRDKTIKAGVASTRYTTRYPRQRAYAMHERCWVLMTRIVDVELINMHLDLFVKALCYRRRQKAEDENPLICEETVWMKWKNRYADSYMMSPRRYTSAYENQMECSDNAYAARDPLNVSKLQKLLKHPERIRRHGLQRKTKMEARKKKKEKKKEKKQKTLKSRTPAPRRMKPFDIRDILIPPEIVMIIMDMLYGPKDIVLLLWVFPQWRLSIHQGYWRIRCIHDFILHGPLPDAAALDWRYLYFNIDRLLSNSHGWRNRRRIMNILEGTRALFLKFVAKSAG